MKSEKMLFKPNNKTMKFRVINLKDKELIEIRDLVEKNGGVLSDESKIIFTNKKTCISNENLFDVKYIHECVRLGRILELLNFKIANDEVRSCWTKILIDEEKHCPNAITHLNGSQSQICRYCKRVIVENEHDEDNYVHAKTMRPGQSNHDHDSYTLKKAALSSTKGISNGTESQSRNTERDNKERNSQADHINAIFPLSAAEEEAEDEFNKDPVVTKNTSNLLNERSQETQNVSVQLCSGSPKQQEIICSGESVAGPSRDRDRSPEVAVIRLLTNGNSKDMIKPLGWSRYDGTRPGTSNDEPVLLDSDSDSIPEKSIVSVSSGSDVVVVKQKPPRRIDRKQTRSDKDKEESSTKSRNDTSSSDDDSASSNRSSAPVRKPIKRWHPSRNFAFWEQREMIKYLIDTNSINEAKGNQVWKQMIHAGHLTHRTYQSLNNHFRRSILPNLKRFNIDPKKRKLFETLIA